jgi:hypothetical protein
VHLYPPRALAAFLGSFQMRLERRWSPTRRVLEQISTARFMPTRASLSFKVK